MFNQRDRFLGTAWTLEEAKALVPSPIGWALCLDTDTALKVERKFYAGQWVWQGTGYDAKRKRELAAHPVAAPDPARNLPYRDD